MAGENYPKWVTPHASHITNTNSGKQIAAKWPDRFFVDRATGILQILVNNKDEETKATGVAS